MKLSELDIHENFNSKEGRMIASLVKPGMTVVEIGSWKGFSTYFLAKAVENGKVFAVDIWEGAESRINEAVGGKKAKFLREEKDKDIYAIFKYNMEQLGVSDIVKPLKMESLFATRLFEDESVDSVFIDADHRYEPFVSDLKAWLPKVKKGGIICGHDCDQRYETFEPGRRRTTLNKTIRSWISGIGHPGVIKGLYDTFGTDYKIIPNSTIWYREV